MLHLSGVTPARPLTLDEARPKIAAALKEERVKAALAAKAEEVRSKIAGELKAGKSFDDAARDAGQTVDNLPGFALANPPPQTAPPDFSELATAGSELPVGELSKFLPSSTGGALVYVRGRAGVDEAQFDRARDGLTVRVRRQKTRAAFEEWLRSSKQAADAKLTVQLRG